MKYGVYPYSDKQRLLVEYLISNDKYEINALIYPRAWKVPKEDIENVTISSDFDNTIKKVDGMIILNNDQYKLTIKKMLMCIELHKSVVCCLKLEPCDYDMVNKKAEQSEVNFVYLPQRNKNIEETLNSRNDFFHSQECVVIAVGMLNGSKSEYESDLILNLVNSFMAKGYSVSSFVSDVNLELAGFERLMPFGFDGLEENQDKFIARLNNYFNYIQMKNKSDLIVLQMPQENVFRMYDSLPVGFGVQVFLISQAVDIDYFIMASGVDITEDSAYQEIGKSIYYRYGFDLDTVVICDRYLDYVESYAKLENICNKTSQQALDECFDELESSKNSSIMYIKHNDAQIGDVISEDCIDKLSDNIDSF